MRGIVVYRSWWGSCRRIAEAIGRGLEEGGHQVEVVPIEDAGKPDPSLDFVVIGAATRWPGAWPKIKRYTRKVLKAGPPGKPFAAFSTGGTLYTDNPNIQSADVIYDILMKGGFSPLAPALKVSIEGYRAPGRTAEDRGTLPDSEVERAVEYGRELGARLSAAERG
jgi:menaquinone-dependent protoporphyrinogen IX oxidase